MRDAGVPTPCFAVAERSADEVADWADFPAFVKPLAEGTGKGCEAASLVHTQSRACTTAVARVIARYRQPALVERYLPGREFTVGIVGNGDDARVLGVCEILLQAQCRGQCLLAPQQGAVRGAGHLRAGRRRRGAACGNAARLQAYRALECRDAARIDFRSDAKGEPYFLEANPLAGLNPWHSDLPILAAQNGIDFVTLIGMVLDAGLARYGRSRGDAGAAAETRLMAGTAGFIPVLHAATRQPPRRNRHDRCRQDGAGVAPRLGYATEVIGLAPDLGGSTLLPSRRPLLVFNLVDAVGGDGRLAPMVPARLDALGLPYTGAGTSAWLDTLSKIGTKLQARPCRPADAGLVGGWDGPRPRSPRHRQAGVGAWLVRHRSPIGDAWRRRRAAQSLERTLRWQHRAFR